MAEKEFFKLYQVAKELMARHGFSQQLIQQYQQYVDVELWLMNTDDLNYQLIRVTLNKASVFEYDRQRVETIIKAISKLQNRQLSFLDIHIANEEYDATNEDKPFLNLEEGFADGINVFNIYPEIYTAIKDDADPETELQKFVDAVDQIIKQKRLAKPFFKRNYPYVTYFVIIVCCLVYLLSLFLSSKYDKSAVYIMLGADYMTFTLGLKQFWRTFTSAFVHGGFLHLATNMYSLYILGAYLERRLKRKLYILTLIVSIITASLTQDILSSNTITVGISGGIYGLLVIFIIDLLRLKVVSFSTFIPLILINVLINTIDTTAWIAHLGGLVAGVVMYFFSSRQDKRGLSVLIVVMILSLFIKYATIKTIEPIYAGTDLEVVRMLNDMGFKKYAVSLWQRLNIVYSTYGG
ncbi:MAG: rhomboid family intramembrane serine protease [Erysipelotrichaceae bacterium]|nr:rhomboid family intramembrane serine protease [Erysipelotrichaceae bacterium]